MNTVKISLLTEYDSVPAHCKIYCCEELIFDSVISAELELSHQINSMDQFSMKVIKSGKTMDIVKKKQRQEVFIKNINLNGVDLKIKEFGKFHLKDNLFVDDQIIQTTQLNLNGEWHFTLPARSLTGIVDVSAIEIRDRLEDCDIACFGCSQTYGAFLDSDQSWPNQLGLITGTAVRNYGIGGSTINEILAFVNHYIKNYKASMILLYLPHSFRRQITIDGKVKNIRPDSPFNKELVLHGEEHSVATICSLLYQWLETIPDTVKIYFGTYQTTEYRLYEKTRLRKFMLPFLEGNNYPKASDNQHHGAEFNVDFARTVYKFLKDTGSSITAK